MRTRAISVFGLNQNISAFPNMNYKSLFTLALCAGMITLGDLSSPGQTAIWTGPASGGEWNTAANWSLGAVPGTGNGAFIGSGTNVSYNLPMAAAGIIGLTNYGTFNVNTNGFNCTAVNMMYPNGSSAIFINTGGVAGVSGNVAFNSNSVVTVNNGGSLTVAGALLIGCGSAGGTSSGTAKSYATMTNNGGTISASSTTLNPANGSISGNCLLVINGGNNNLGTTTVKRTGSSTGGFVTLGTEGLVIYGGQVIITNLNIGGEASTGAGSTPGNSYLTTLVAGGAVTNFGNVYLNQQTAGRPSRFLQNGGLFVVPDPGLVNADVTNAATVYYAVNGGTNIVGGFYFGVTNTFPNSGSASVNNFTNAAAVYIGSQGIASNGTAVVNISLNNGGLFGATAPWTGSASMKLAGGTFTFQAADPLGNPNGITLISPLTGIGSLNKTGGGTLTLDATNTYAGATTIGTGSLALGATGALTSPEIVVGSGTIFDVSQTGGFVLNGGQTLAGFGTVTGAVTAASSATIYPGSNSLTGTLTFSNAVTENGGVNNEFNLSGNPAGPNNDFINAAGGLVLSGTNTVTLNGALASGGIYRLINYGGSLTGDIANLTVIGATGTFSNSPVAGMIYFIAQTSVRGPTNITWIGNSVVNNWDVENTTNWLNNGTGLLDFFVAGDNALFSNLGASNSTVNIPDGTTVTPGSMVVNTSSNYTFTGNGAIGGVGGLTISNGALTILTTNIYTGPTVLDGGVLATPTIANGGSPSGIGSASSSPANLIFNGGTFSYFGASAGTDHGITLTNLGGTIDVTNGSTLTVNGTLVGNGGLTLVDSGTLELTAGNTYTGSTTISNGTLNLNNAVAAGTGAIALAGGTLDLTVGSQPTFANNLNIAANSTLTSAGGNNNILSGPWAGPTNATLAVGIASGGTLTISGSMTNFLGTVLLTGAGTFRFNSAGGAGGDTAFGGQNTTYDLGSAGILNARNSDTINLGTLEGSVGSTLSGQGSGNGTLIWVIGASTNNPNSDFAGIISDGSVSTRVTSITKVGNGSLKLEGQNTYTGTTIIDSGRLALVYNPTNSADGSINNSATINIVSGAVLDVSGRSDGTFQLDNATAQTLEGRGTLNGSLNVGGSGTVAPGGGPGGNTGTLTVTNAITLGATAWMKLNRANTPNSDQLVSSLSTITYGGTLVVTNIGGRLQAGDTFTLFSGGGLSGGTFSTIILPNYYNWNTNNLGVNGSISVAAVLPPPAITNVDISQLSLGTITLNASGGAPNSQVIVVTSTNLSLPLSSWTSIATNAFDPNGNLSIPVTANPALPQNFYQLEAF